MYKIFFLFIFTAALLIAWTPSRAAKPVRADFDGDGFEDLVIGVPGESLGLGGVWVGAGTVEILYGGPNGLPYGIGHQSWNQMAGLGGEKAEADDQFGAALAIGNFNGDDYDDLAIGAPGEDLDGKVDAGVVHILYGSPAGLSVAGEELWGQGPTNPPVGKPGENFGAALATGDLNGDGFDDLAVGIPNRNIRIPGSSVAQEAGAILVMLGSDTGMSPGRIWRTFQGGGGTNPEHFPESEDHFGSALAAGDFNQDGYDDLAIGAPFEDVGPVKAAGAVTVIYGSATGPFPTTPWGWQFWHQGSPGLPGTDGNGNIFGLRLATGDFDGDGADDLAIGAPGQDLHPRFFWRTKWTNAGAVQVMYGQTDMNDEFGGLSTTGNQLWTQNSPGILGRSETDDFFGDALAAGDYDGNGVDDLAIGASGESVSSVAFAGSVNVLYGRINSGLSQIGNQLWHENRRGFSTPVEERARFGSTLAVGDFDTNGLDDLAIGVPSKDYLGQRDSGVVHVLYNFGRPRFRLGPAIAEVQLWYQELMGLPGATEAGDQFGGALPLSRSGF